MPLPIIIQTRVTQMLGIDHPIIMGGMTGVGTPELAAAVSNAGGLGIFCAHNMLNHPMRVDNGFVVCVR